MLAEAQHADVHKVALSALLAAALAIVAEADGLAVRRAVGALLKLLSALAVLALAFALSTLSLGRALCSVPGLGPLSVQGQRRGEVALFNGGLFIGMD